MPKVSVIIPTYNRSTLVKQAVNSVLSQSLKNFEILVVDDGSTDDTKDVIQSINDDRVKYYYKKNGGPASARNFGLLRARGDYVAFLDHDDLWPENFLEVMTTELENHKDYGLAYTPITPMCGDGQIVKSYKKLAGKSGWITLDLFKRGFVWTSAAIIRKSILDDFYYDESLHQSYEDGDYFLRLSVRTPFLFVDEVEAIRREHTQNLSAKIGIQPTRLLVLERFYYKLGGYRLIPTRIARSRLSHACKKIAQHHRYQKNRPAAMALYKRAIKYWPFDLRLYWGIFMSWIMINKNSDLKWNSLEPLDEIKI